MADLALRIQDNAPRDPLRPATAPILSSFSEALDRAFTLQNKALVEITQIWVAENSWG